MVTLLTTLYMPVSNDYFIKSSIFDNAFYSKDYKDVHISRRFKYYSFELIICYDYVI